MEDKIIKGKPEDQKQNEGDPKSKDIHRSRLEKIKDFLSVFQSLVTVLAIVAAAVWFIMQHELTPKANISHKIIHRQLSDSDKIWLNLSVSIVNPGKRPVVIKTGTFWIQGILPLEESVHDLISSNDPDNCFREKSEITWPLVGNSYDNIPLDLTIFPGETSSFCLEFLIPSYMKTIKIYSNMEKQKNVGWLEKNLGWLFESDKDIRCKFMSIYELETGKLRNE